MDRHLQMEYGLDLSSSSSSSSDEDVSVSMPLKMRPTELLNIAVSKRREQMRQKNKDIRCELLQVSFIKKLCKHINDCKNDRLVMKRRTTANIMRSTSKRSCSATSRSTGTSNLQQKEDNDEPRTKKLNQEHMSS